MNYKILSLLAIVVFLISSCEKENRFDENGVLVPLTVIEDSTIPSINIDGILLHSETYGDPTNPMIVVIHGGPGGDYRGMLKFKELANDDMFVVFYDQRGAGLSERVDESAFGSVQVYIDELDAVINHYRHDSDQQIVLAGHSWGAMLATAYVNQNSNNIDGLILAEPGGFTWGQTETYLSKSRELKLFDELTNDFVYQDQFITGSDHNTLDYKMALSTAGVSTGDMDFFPYWRFGAICLTASIQLAMDNPDQMDFTANLNNFGTKVLFAYSELNTAYGLEHAEKVSDAFPLVQLEKIQDCGHEIPHFGWQNFYPLIQNYLIEIL